MSWNRKLWGVEFFSEGTKPHLIGTLWASRIGNYPEEPTRALLFNTRKQAREWCKKNAWFGGRKDFCSKWHFRPVRVVETVRKI